MDKRVTTILLIEDNPGDIRLIREMLVEAEDRRFRVHLADHLSAALACLTTGKIDVVLADLNLPDSRGLATCVSIHERAPTVPIVILTGLDDEQLAIRAVRDGVQDYLVKARINSNLLVRAIRYAIERNRLEQEREQLISELKAALAQVKTLSGLLPICSNCKKIRDDEGYWTEVEVYLWEHSDADFTHSICPDCARKLYPSLYRDVSE
jgi:PleD family two-component response regulator